MIMSWNAMLTTAIFYAQVHSRVAKKEGTIFIITMNNKPSFMIFDQSDLNSWDASLTSTNVSFMVDVKAYPLGI